MPVSRIRRKNAYTPPQASDDRGRLPGDNPRWLVPAMLAFFGIGLVYIVVYYVAGSSIPVMSDLSPILNVGIGFGFVVLGFVLMTRWR